MNKIYAEVHAMAEIRRKIAAFRELFQRPPAVMLAGTWTDEDGDAVFFDTHPSQSVEVHRGYLVAAVDGESAELRPTKFSGIYLY